MSNTDLAGAAPNVFQTRTMRLLLLAGIVLGVVALDQFSKQVAVAHLKHRAPTNYVYGIFTLTYAENPGAFLSLGRHLSESQRFWILTCLNGVILLIVLGYVLVKDHVARWNTVALALILAGGIGNIIDRVHNSGLVVDFMNMGVPPAWFSLRTGIFNVADIAIMGGLFLLIGIEMLPRRAHASATPQPET